MWQSRADSSSETFLTRALRKRSKIYFLNMVSYITFHKHIYKLSPAKIKFTLVPVYYNFSIIAGPLSEVLFPIDNLTKRPKGFAFVMYMIPENAVTALAQLDGHIFQV